MGLASISWREGRRSPVWFREILGWCTRPGKQTVRYWSHGPVEMVDLPINSMVDLSIVFWSCLPGRVVYFGNSWDFLGKPVLFFWKLTSGWSMALVQIVKIWCRHRSQGRTRWTMALKSAVFGSQTMNNERQSNRICGLNKHSERRWIQARQVGVFHLFWQCFFFDFFNLMKTPVIHISIYIVDFPIRCFRRPHLFFARCLI